MSLLVITFLSPISQVLTIKIILQRIQTTCLHVSCCHHCNYYHYRNVDFVLFHNVTCYNNFFYHRSMLTLHITCTLIVTSVILWSLECKKQRPNFIESRYLAHNYKRHLYIWLLMDPIMLVLIMQVWIQRLLGLCMKRERKWLKWSYFFKDLNEWFKDFKNSDVVQELFLEYWWLECMQNECESSKMQCERLLDQLKNRERPAASCRWTSTGVWEINPLKFIKTSGRLSIILEESRESTSN